MKPFFLIFLLALGLSAIATPPMEEGKTLFTARCANCHNINKDFVGPALRGVDKRREMDWIVKFVQSSQTLVKSGDKAAMELFAKFKVVMPDQPDLSATDVKNIVEFIKIESNVSEASAAPFARPASPAPPYSPVAFTDSGFIYGFLLAIALLIFSLLLYIKVKQYEHTKVW